MSENIYLVRHEDKVIKLTSKDMNVLVDVCNTMIKYLKREMNLFDKEYLLESVLLIEYVEDIRDVLNKIDDV